MSNNGNITSKILAEFIGTFFLVFIGCGISIFESLSIFSIAFIWGGTLCLLIFLLGKYSGAHFNPAVSMAFGSIGKLSLYETILFVLAQILAAIFALILLNYLFYSAIDFGVTKIKIGLASGFILELILTLFLVAVIFFSSSKNLKLTPLYVGATLGTCILIAGPGTGASFNPARSIGPALVSQNFQNLWVYLIAPIFGALIGIKLMSARKSFQ